MQPKFFSFEISFLRMKGNVFQWNQYFYYLFVRSKRTRKKIIPKEANIINQVYSCVTYEENKELHNKMQQTDLHTHTNTHIRTHAEWPITRQTFSLPFLTAVSILSTSTCISFYWLIWTYDEEEEKKNWTTTHPIPFHPFYVIRLI